MSLQKWAERVVAKFRLDRHSFTETCALRAEHVVALVAAAKQAGLSQRHGGEMLLRLVQFAEPWPDLQKLWRKAVALELGEEWTTTPARAKATVVPLAQTRRVDTSGADKRNPSKSPLDSKAAKRAKRPRTAQQTEASRVDWLQQRVNQLGVQAERDKEVWSAERAELKKSLTTLTAEVNSLQQPRERDLARRERVLALNEQKVVHAVRGNSPRLVRTRVHTRVACSSGTWRPPAVKLSLTLRPRPNR
jgi:hypothetical protein